MFFLPNPVLPSAPSDVTARRCGGFLRPIVPATVTAETEHVVRCWQVKESSNFVDMATLSIMFFADTDVEKALGSVTSGWLSPTE